MAFKLIYFIALLVLAYGAPTDGCQCSKMNVIPDFDVQKIEGVWYMYAYNSRDHLGAECLRFDIFPANNSQILSQKLKQYFVKHTLVLFNTFLFLDGIAVKRIL